MSRHRKSDPAGDNHVPEDNYLIVTVTSESYSRFVASSTGWPRLVIDYGGAALVLDVADLRHAETFGLALARSSLDFVSQCRYLMDETHE